MHFPVYVICTYIGGIQLLRLHLGASKCKCMQTMGRGVNINGNVCI